jgi:hypothetical protein
MPVGPEEARTSCPACQTEYHAECWQENGGCAVYGCCEVPPVEARQAVEVPMSFWGRETKPCPVCAQEILAAAVRCRHCGATFASARPEDSAEFQQRAEREQRRPATQRAVITLFILSIVPCLAPIGAIAGFVWHASHREDARALPALFSALRRIGLIVAIGQTAMLLVMALLYSRIRGS